MRVKTIPADPQIYDQLTFDNKARISPSTGGVGKIYNLHAKLNLTLILTLCTKINSKWTQGLDMKDEAIS